jgi:hypothetical protein
MMNIHYKIVEVWPNDHLIVARYWTDTVSEESLASDSNRKEDGTPVRCRSDVAITLPIPAPTGIELEKIILANAPRAWLETLEKVADPNIDTSLNDIQSLLGVTKSKTTQQIEDILNVNPASKQLSDSEITDLIAKLQER